ncbi:MAG: hypothetical protein LBI53_05260 [Candidatus Peribacteria bacterium]|jgi:hypothetical protein|nr:hypothetical protein [Candidatus Peribacteria bacterium]
MVDFYYSDCEIEKSNETTKRKSVLFGFSDVMIWSIEDRIKWLDTMSDRAGVLGCNWGNMK